MRDMAKSGKKRNFPLTLTIKEVEKSMDPERWRLGESSQKRKPWKKWGPYLSERQWGTVREDYSADGNPWNYFSHDQARSRAYRWGEDGIGGISDDRQLLCFALALWNGKDPILKERLFGLTNGEGNHGEDCKEYYFYLDNTPTHSYMKYLYKYPQIAYPYDNLVEVNHHRGRFDLEYELLDTGVFDSNRYFDVFIEYCKESPEDILIAITAFNRGDGAAELHLLPTLWFRNTWFRRPGSARPILRLMPHHEPLSVVEASNVVLGTQYWYGDHAVPVLFTENETNNRRLFGKPNVTRFVKDGINNYIVSGERESVGMAGPGTKASFHYRMEIGPGQSTTVRLRLTDVPPSKLAETYREAVGDPFGSHFDNMFALRRNEADEFYDSVIPQNLTEDERNVMRQALAGMIWSKQYYELDVETWLEEHGSGYFDGSPARVRNSQWFHMVNADIISMPDKWEYPWFASWDLAFHTLALSLVDPEFANQQLELMLGERYLHPNGQIPAYEWNFGDVNPPVHAWACIFNYRLQKVLKGDGDIVFLKNAFQKLLLNFTWWLNRMDREGTNLFAGGFVGLDNVGVFDRNAFLPAGGYIEQADGTSWMALFSQNMLEIALELALTDHLYEGLACKFLEHFMWISSAMNRIGRQHESMWDEQDGFFYDVLRLPDGHSTRLKVRSVAGLVPLCASTVYDPNLTSQLPDFMSRTEWFQQNHPEVLANIRRPGQPGAHGRYLLALLDDEKLRRVLTIMLDEREFLSDFGIRSISRVHSDQPYVFDVNGQEFRVSYTPAESNNQLFGGNSNWQGPIWMPVNALILRALLQLYSYYGDDFVIDCPSGSGHKMNLFEVARDLEGRLAKIFVRDENGRRPLYGGSAKFQMDPHWRDYLLFYEYFHGDNGAGLGAGHQTGWTGLIARALQLKAMLEPRHILEGVAFEAVHSRPLTA